MQIDRTIAPEAHAIKNVQLIRPQTQVLSNGIPFFALRAGSQQVLRLEFIFDAGIRKQNRSLIASITNAMLVEGTPTKTAQQIAEMFDYYGAFIQPEIDNDRASLTLHCLTSSFAKVFPLLKEILEEATFPEKELKTNLDKGRQQFVVNQSKVDYLARQRFMEAVFGMENPYGRQTREADFNTLSRAALLDFHAENYQASGLTIIASGQFGDDIREIIDSSIGQWNISGSVEKNWTPGEYPAPTKLFIEKPDAIQTGIRIGRRMVNKTHADFAGLQVLNTALGGYFGSRLMANIREDKGYTYGIGSAVVSLEKEGYFFIATEVGADVAKDAVAEIYKEIQLLREKTIPIEELQMVKNYMLGSFLRNSDGPFAMADRFKALHFYGLDYSHYDRFLNTVNTITAQEIKDLAIKYLNPGDMTEILAGKS